MGRTVDVSATVGGEGVRAKIHIYGDTSEECWAAFKEELKKMARHCGLNYSEPRLNAKPLKKKGKKKAKKKAKKKSKKK